MKKIAWIILGSLAFQTTVLAGDFNIEDNQLQPVSIEASSAIQADKSFSEYKHEGCNQLVGIAVDLDGTGKQAGWVATTANGCAWGASAGPIWVLYRQTMNYTVVLATGGHNLTIGKAKQNGLRHLAISSGSAGWYSESLLKFDGSKYVVTKSREVNLGDPDACRKNKDVCP